MSKKGNDHLSNNSASQSEELDEEMTVTLDLEDGTSVNCAIVTILSVKDQDYIVLLPLDPNEDPTLEYIEDDEEYEIVSDAFDEYLDNAEFDEFIEEE